MSILTKKNLGSCFHAERWTEYPAFGKKWRDNWDATFNPEETKEQTQDSNKKRPQGKCRPDKSPQEQPKQREICEASEVCDHTCCPLHEHRDTE